MGHHRRNDFLIPTLGVLLDAIAIEGAFLFSYWLRFHTSIFDLLPISEDTPPLDAYIYGSFVVIPIWLIIFKSRGLYGARRNIELTDELVDIVKVVTLGMLIVMSAAFFYRAFSYSRIVFGLLWATSTVFAFVGRVILLNIEKTLYRHGRELWNAIIIGSTDRANRVCHTIRDHPLLGYRLVGYVADTPSHETSPLGREQRLGTVCEAPGIIVEEDIELALIALDHHDHRKLYELMEECEGVNVEFLLVPDILELMTSRMSVREIEGIPFIKIKGMPMTTWGRILKRSFDVVVAGSLIVIFSPIFLLIALLIKLDSRGPILFRQERVGMDGERFSMLKFRSMKVGAEQSDDRAGLGIENDSRRTRLGVFLRKTSLDELPQLHNVLKGEMSLVGPRPERTRYVEQFQDTVPRYLDRHRVKAGVTGWAQVNGFRGNTSLEERIKYDLYYIENWSLGFDLMILMKTLRALLSSKNVH